jgi:hypothetical protein
MSTKPQETTLLSKLDFIMSGTYSGSNSKCAIGKIIAAVDTKTADKLVTVLQSDCPSLYIVKALIEEGHSIGKSTLHLKRECFKEGTKAKCKCFPDGYKVSE